MKKRVLCLVAAAVIALMLPGCFDAGEEIDLSGPQREIARLTGCIVSLMDELVASEAVEEEPEPEPTAAFKVGTGYERHEDRAEDAKIDIRLPVISGSRAAESINAAIEKDFADEKAMTLEDLMENGFGYYYPWLNIHYKAIEIDSLWSVNVFTEYSSAAGSGVLILVDRYYYDVTEDRCLTEDMYLAGLGVTKEDIVTAFYGAVSEDPVDDEYSVSYEDISKIYYIEKDKEIVVFIRQ